MAPKSKKGKTVPSKPVESSTPTAPFVPPPSPLSPLLDLLQTDPPNIYILSLDTHPSSFKLKIFLVPLFTNLILLAFLVYRLWTIAPFYLSLVLYLLFQTQNNNIVVQPAALTWNEILRVVVKRAGTFALDFGLWRWVVPMVWGFFWGSERSGSPLGWRYRIRWREKEVAVRRSKAWGSGIIVEDLSSEEGEAGMKKTRVLEIVRRATEPLFMHEKTTYLMLSKEWDLDWRLMVLAHELVDRRKLTLEDFANTTVLVHGGEAHGWLMLESESIGGSNKEEEGRKKILAFKDELTKLGKESLFFRWIELVQFESSKQEGWGLEQQRRTMEQARSMFENEGVDFDAFWKKVGGMEGLPGMGSP